MTRSNARARIITGDAASVLRQRLVAGSIDLVYLDPPFGTQKDWTGTAGRFSDRFAWDRTARRRAAKLRQARPRWAPLFDALPIGDRDRAYLVFLAELLLELRRVMRSAASLWLHCDDTMGAYIRCVLDAVLGPENFIGTVFWKRTTSHSMESRAYGRVHDSIHVYGRAGRRLEAIDGVLLRQGFSETRLNSTSGERVGYPTQKPVPLLEEIVQAATRPGDTVLDPTCGSGTTLVAALRLGRRPIGIDRSADACRIAATRLRFVGKK